MCKSNQNHINIVMTVKDRPQLTYQALVSLHKNTFRSWNLTIVDDGSDQETAGLLMLYQGVFRGQVLGITVAPDRLESGIVGRLKNLGVAASSAHFGRSDYLYLSDNDVYFTEGWDNKLTAIARDFPLNYALYGGQNHPYHKPIGHPCRGFSEYLAVAGTSWLMRWDAWDQYGPLDGNAQGVCQSEDTAFCNRIRQAGYKVGAMNPPVVLDTGITQTDGSPSIGHEAKPREEGVCYQ